MGTWTTLGDLLNITFTFSAALIFAAMGGIFSERSGVVNIALEGLMVAGAFAAAIGAYYMEQADMAGLAPWIGLLCAAVFGAAFSLIHAFATITYRADQVVSGVVINFLALGFCVYMVPLLFDGAGQTRTLIQGGFEKRAIPVLSQIPVLGKGVFTSYPTTYLALVSVVIMWYVLFRTPFGLRLRAVGEHPGAADTVGVKVNRVKYIGVMLSGMLAGIGGATITLTTSSNFAHNTVSGQGFIALAAVIFGKWHPFGALAAATFFGFSQALGSYVQIYEWANQIPREWIYMLPYVLTLIVLAGFVGKSVAPASLGEPYDPGKR
ncbi:ABC transporter permease [Marinicrinis sediminis]|uniref:ABC transporter permease n=1 Tax=Marinicrinis sediminis TaxID=1652465 RepID=A0ABW5RC64_9BACL